MNSWEGRLQLVEKEGQEAVLAVNIRRGGVHGKEQGHGLAWEQMPLIGVLGVQRSGLQASERGATKMRLQQSGSQTEQGSGHRCAPAGLLLRGPLSPRRAAITSHGQQQMGWHGQSQGRLAAAGCCPAGQA